MKGVFILKPDFFNEFNFKTFCQLVHEKKIQIHSLYRINDYYNFCSEYRKYDIANAIDNREELLKELKRTQFATYTYKTVFTDKRNVGVAIIMDGEGEEFFNKLLEVKTEMRNIIKANRKIQFYVDIEKNPWEVIKCIKGQTSNKEYFEKDNVKIAYLNAIHLEDAEMFNRQICFAFLQKSDTLNKCNKISFNELKGMCQTHESVQNYEQ